MHNSNDMAYAIKHNQACLVIDETSKIARRICGKDTLFKQICLSGREDIAFDYMQDNLSMHWDVYSHMYTPRFT